MDAIGFALIGIGGYFMYAAYKSEHPWTMFQHVIGKTSASVPLGTVGTPNAQGVYPQTAVTTPTGNTGGINSNGGTGTTIYGPSVP